MLTALTNATIYTGTEMIAGKTLLIENDIIQTLTENILVPAGAKTIDCSGLSVAPGLVDLQIAGGGGYLFSDHLSAEALESMTESIIKSGTTGFLIALPSNSQEVYIRAIRVVKKNPHPAVLGLHLEGPYISPVRPGAHTSQFIRQPEADELRRLMAEAEGVIRMITLAPEVCTTEIVKLINDHGIVVAAGHSNATFEEALGGFNSGVRTITHLFNAMSPMHHRDPGLPGAAFMSDSVYASIIADGIHVNYNMLAISKKIMRERLFLVSDAVEESKKGAYPHIRQKDRFTLPDGTLSGSSLTMMEAVRNCVYHAGIPLDEALRMASLYPLKLMNITDKGKISEGYKADLVIFDKDYNVINTCLNGSFHYLPS